MAKWCSGYTTAQRYSKPAWNPAYRGLRWWEPPLMATPRNKA